MRLLLLASVLFFNFNLLAQSGTSQAAPAPKDTEDFSGTYSFLRDGEFLQLNIEDDGKVTGFVSRYGDTATDRGLFLDHFFQDGKLDGKKLSFTTKVVHGVSYEFKGTVDRGDGKRAGDEAFYVLKGTLVQSTIDAQQKTTSKSQDVVFKSFPQDLNENPPAKKN